MENQNLQYTYAQLDERVFLMDKKDRAFSILTALLVTPTVSLTLWGGFNIGFTLSLIAFTLLFGFYLGGKRALLSPFSVIALALAVCGFFVYTVSADNTVRLFLFLPLTLGLFLWLLNISGYEIKDDCSVISVCISGLHTMFSSIGKSVKSFFALGGKMGKGMGKALIGIACAVPAVIVVAALLRSSDAAFDGLVSKIGNSFGGFGSTVVKIITGVLCFPLMLSLGLGLSKNKKEQKLMGIKGAVDKIFIISFLSAISFVYVAYIASQFAYFFSAFRGILPEGITFASYARRGFFEMTAIAAINFTLISLACVLIKKDENQKQSKLFNGVVVFIAAFTVLLIATAVSKMVLYIGQFGMTRLRILTSVFMLFLAVLFIAVILRVFIKRVQILKTGLIAAMLLLLILGFADVDKTVARYNLYAYESNLVENLDVNAIGDLGEGAIPTLYEIYSNKDYDVSLRLAAKKELMKDCEKMYQSEYVDGRTVYTRKRSVGDFNLSRYKAQRALDRFLGIE